MEQSNNSIYFAKWLSLIDNKQYTNSFKQELQEYIIQQQDPSLAFFFAQEFNFNNHLMQKIILKQKNPYYAFLFAKHINYADIKALQKIVDQSNNIKYICHFAAFVPKAKILKAKQIVIKNNNSQYAIFLIKNIKLKDLKQLKKVIFNSNNPKYIYQLSNYMISLRELKKIVNFLIKSQSWSFLTKLSLENKNVDLLKIEQAILNSNDQKAIKKFAKSTKNSFIRNFLILE